MAGKASYGGWGLANYSAKKICWLKIDISSYLKTWGFSLVGWPYGDKEIVLLIWLFLSQGWIRDKIMGG
jgi:hypothetical protein